MKIQPHQLPVLKVAIAVAKEISTKFVDIKLVVKATVSLGWK